MPLIPESAIPGHLHIFCQKVLPAVFDDSLSYYEVVCKLVKSLNDDKDLLNQMVETLNLHSEQIATIQEWINNFPNDTTLANLEIYINQWVNQNLEYIFGTVVKQVFFGITVDGYFAAYIPQSWNDIIFDTGFNYNLDTYGRLILRWNVDSVHPVNMTREAATFKRHGATVIQNARPTV